jgi:mannosyltransferase
MTVRSSIATATHRTAVRRAAPLAILLLAFAVRVHALDAQSLWFDEGWSWHLARMPLDDMARITAGDRSPALYYALLHGWLLVAGQSEFAMRLVSALADAAAAACVVALARRLHGNTLLAGLIYALCPAAIWYAQETRMYALVAALGAGASLALWHWLTHRKAPSLAASALLLALAVNSHYYAVFLVPGHALAVLIHANASRRAVLRGVLSWSLAAAAVVLSVLPWLLYARGGFAYDDGFAFPLNTVAGRMLEWLRWFASGALPAPVDPRTWLLLGLATGLAIGALIAQRRATPAIYLLCLILVPLLAATVAVRLFYPYRSVFHARYLIALVPAACVLLGAAGWRRPAGQMLAVAQLGLLAALWLPGLRAYMTEPTWQRDDVRSAVRHVVDALEPGDVIIMSRDNFAVTYYFPAARQAQLMAAPDGLHGLLRDDALVLQKLNAGKPRRVRLLLWQDDVVDPQRFIETTLWANGRQVGEYNFGQIRLPLYQLDRSPIEALPLREFGAHFEGQGDRITLNRAWLTSRATAGDWFYAVLEWAPPQAVARDYKVFLHVLDQSGQIAFQQDKLTLNALLPTSTWPAGVSQRDPYAIVVPAGLSPGRYTVRIGLYDPQRDVRLTTSGADGITLGEVDIVAR